MRVLVLMLICLALPAWAERITVRSGEHPEFSRLVIALPRDTGWRQEGAAVVFTRPVDLDTAEVFRLIPRTRLSAIAAEPAGGKGGTRLTLELACPCPVSAREERPGLLVIDIGNPQSPAPVKVPVAFPRRMADDLEIYWARHGRGMATPPRQALVGETRGRLLEGFSRAFAQGMIELEDTPKFPGTVGGDRPLPLRTQTALERDSAPPPDPPPPSACLSPSKLDIAHWAEGTGFVREIGLRRSVLLGEFDRADPEAVQRLARFYLHYGFGAEAGALLHIYPGAEDGELLTAIAAVIEGQPAPMLAGQRNCPGPAALWGLLADPSTGGGFARDGAIQSFLGLPSHLRDLLGPRLVTALRARGEEDALRVIRDSTLRAVASPDSALAMMEAGTRPEAEDALRRVLAANTPESPEALLLLIHGRLDRGEPVEAALAVLAAGMAREYRHTPLAPRLTHAHILSLASTGLFDEAFELASTQQDVRGPLLAMLTRAAPDTIFLRHALTAAPLGAKPEGLVPAMAARLLSLGFPQEARGLLRLAGEAEEERLLSARAALAAADPAGALAALAGLPGPEAETIRAEAFLRLGQPGPALAAAGRTGQAERRVAIAWRTGDWAEVRAHGSDAQKAALAALPEAGGGEAADLPTLAGNRARLEDSRRMRETLDDLLSVMPPLTESQDLPR